MTMSKERQSNCSPEDLSCKEWNIEGNEAKLRDAISRLRALVSGEID